MNPAKWLGTICAAGVLAFGGLAEAAPLDVYNEFIAKSDQELDQLGKIHLFESGKYTLKVSGEARYRLEVRDDFTFNNTSYEDDAFHLLRTRLGIEAGMPSIGKVFVQGQDAESFASSSLNQTNAFVDRFDLRQLFVELKSPWEEAPAKLKIGRQELAYGEQRFVGAFDWSNVARVFDAVKLSVTPTDKLQVDAWVSQPVLVTRVTANSADHEDHFYGIYAAGKPFRDHILDTFLFVRHDLDNEIAGEISGHRGQLKEYTLGNRFRGRYSDFDYGVEWALQLGSRAHEDIVAWALHNELGYTFVRAPWSPRVGMEYNHGSGDNETSDGNFGTFDNLFPTNHPHYGFMDLASLRNIDQLETNLSAKPFKSLMLTSKYHWFFLDSNKSAWFNAGQGVIRPARANASQTIGQELDLLAKWTVSKHIDTLFGYSHFFPGPFIKDTGADNDANFFYWQTAVKF